MPLPAGRHADPFSRVGNSLPTSFDSGIDPKIVADRIGHANMEYTLSIYTHRSTGKDKRAAETRRRCTPWSRVDMPQLRGRLHRHSAAERTM
jgi:hypothetical protein